MSLAYLVWYIGPTSSRFQGSFNLSFPIHVFKPGWSATATADGMHSKTCESGHVLVSPCGSSKIETRFTRCGQRDWLECPPFGCGGEASECLGTSRNLESVVNTVLKNCQDFSAVSTGSTSNYESYFKSISFLLVHVFTLRTHVRRFS